MRKSFLIVGAGLLSAVALTSCSGGDGHARATFEHLTVTFWGAEVFCSPDDAAPWAINAKPEGDDEGGDRIGVLMENADTTVTDTVVLRYESDDAEYTLLARSSQPGTVVRDGQTYTITGTGTLIGEIDGEHIAPKDDASYEIVVTCD